MLRCRLLALVALPAVAVLPVLAGASAGHADVLGDARQRAAALQHRLDALQQQADAAVEAYDLAQGRLAQAVADRTAAERQVEAAQTRARGTTARADARVRALYEQGPAGLYATVLQGSDLGDAVDRVRAVQRVVRGDTIRQAGDQAALGRLAAMQASSRAADAAALTRVAQVQRLGDQVRALLAQTVSAVAGADAQVLADTRAQQDAQARAQAAAFAAQLAAARAAAVRAPSPALGGSSPALAGGATAPAADGPLVARVLAAARAQLGKPYVWGATGPESFDCSGLTGWAFAAAGVSLPRTAAQQYLAGPHPALADLAAGDLLFWASDPSDPATIDHVTIYLGGGLMIAAPHTGDVVKVEPVYAAGFAGATRVQAAAAAAVPGPRWLPGG